ncbi:MAG TPA: histidine phosphatase family protein [Acidimicrobiales bacterium]|jgi:probable phosphoglycerate mutase|nr:histidine phosphatase family protein [Acidimicrobiales bacterium]
MDPTASRCFLIRHGETEWSLSRRHTGRTDLPLLPEGRRQAESLRSVLAPYSFRLVLHSPLARASETCRLAGLGQGAVTEPDLAEWDYGAYEGLTTPEILEKEPGWDLWRDGCPGGETPAQVGARVDRVIAKVRSAPGDVACVAHSHVLRALGARWVGLPVEGGKYFTLDPASLSILAWERERPVVNVWNRT